MDLKPEVIKTSIESLLKLQEIDGQLFQFYAEVKTPSQEYRDLQLQLDEAQKAHKNLDRIFRDIDRDRRALELRTLTLKDDIKRAESKKREVRNTKEEFAATREFETFQKRADENGKLLEEKQKNSTEKQLARDEKQKLVSELETKLKDLDEKRKVRGTELATEIKNLEAQREAYISLVDDSVFSLYERVQKIRKGNGIAIVKGLTCSGCFVSIPPQLRHRLDKLEEIITCPSCSRILFPSDASDSTTIKSIAS